MVHYTQKGLNLPNDLSVDQQNSAFGLLLGDSWLQTLSHGKRYRMRFEQGDCHREYIEHLATLVYPWVQKPPVKYERKNTLGNTVITWRCQSLTHEAFLPLAYVFYPNGTPTKTIRPDFVENWLTPVGLAYWFMDDGGKAYYGDTRRYGIHLHTQGFQPHEVEYLADGLSNVYKLESWVRFNKNRYMIVISGKSYKRFLRICGSWIHPSMYSKLPCEGSKLMT